MKKDSHKKIRWKETEREVGGRGIRKKTYIGVVITRNVVPSCHLAGGYRI